MFLYDHLHYSFLSMIGYRETVVSTSLLHSIAIPVLETNIRNNPQHIMKYVRSVLLRVRFDETDSCTNSDGSGVDFPAELD